MAVRPDIKGIELPYRKENYSTREVGSLGKDKGKVTFFLVNVGRSFSYEAGIHGNRRFSFYHPLPVLRFTDTKNYSYTDQKFEKVETDVEVTED